MMKKMAVFAAILASSQLIAFAGDVPPTTKAATTKAAATPDAPPPTTKAATTPAAAPAATVKAPVATPTVGATVAAPAAPPAAEQHSMAPPAPGPETKALDVFNKGSKYTGKMLANAMGPGSPEIPLKGEAKCKWVQKNLWMQCDVNETYGTGKTAEKMSGSMWVGWDFGEKAYRSYWVDSMGMSVALRGTMEATKFTLESTTPVMMGPVAMPMRLTWDWTDAKAPTLEMAVLPPQSKQWTVMTHSQLAKMNVKK